MGRASENGSESAATRTFSGNHWLTSVHGGLQELELLVHKTKLEEEGRSAVQDRRQSAASRQAQANGDPPLDEQLRQQLQLAAAALQNPRAAAQEGVFRPSHQLPTISIEQQVQQKLYNLCTLDAQDRGQGQSNVLVPPVTSMTRAKQPWRAI